MDYKGKTIESYDRHTEQYADYFKDVLDIYRREEFVKFLELIPEGGKVLDLGCGAGDHSVYFEEQGLHMRCIDLSEGMVKICRDKSLDATVMDIEDLKFEDNSFDGIWAVTSLLHIERENISGVVDKLSDILRPGGTLYTCVKEGEGEEFIEDKYDGSTGRRFVYWDEETWNDSFGRRFVLLDFVRKMLGNTVFLESFYMNEKD